MAPLDEDYSASRIKMLSTAEHIRARLGMYVGPLENPLLPNLLLQESLCLALDEACCNERMTITITLHRDGSATVEDNGRGLPLVDGHNGRPGAESLMTALYTCRQGKLHEEVGQEICQIGVAVMNALSEWCDLTTTCEGSRWRQRYRVGEPQGPFERMPDDARPGTTLTFKLDASILPRTTFDAAHLAAWLRELGPSIVKADVWIADER